MLRNLLYKKEYTTDYFYDTPTLLFYNQHAQVGIRKAANSFMGYVCSNHQVLNTFRLSELPKHLMVDGVSVSLKGSVSTERSMFCISNEIVFILDKDVCLDEEFFELNIEYSNDVEDSVQGILILVQDLIGRTLKPLSFNKSDRLFKQLSENRGDIFA